MKKLIIIMFVFISFFNTWVLANWSKNTQVNIKKAILVEEYIIKHKEKVEEYIIKYKINNSNINYNIWELNDLIKILKSIQNNNIKKEKAEEIIAKTLTKLKTINNNLKHLLKNEKSSYNSALQEKIHLYTKLWKKISDKIDNINYKIAENTIKNKKILSLKESNIKKHLIVLNNENKKLKNIENEKFSSEKEIKTYFIKILKNIKNELNLIRKTLK